MAKEYLKTVKDEADKLRRLDALGRLWATIKQVPSQGLCGKASWLVLNQIVLSPILETADAWITQKRKTLTQADHRRTCRSIPMSATPPH